MTEACRILIRMGSGRRLVDLASWAARPVAIEPKRPNGCNPVEHATPAEGDDARRVRCMRLDECLTYAGAMGWPGFSCRRCKVMAEHRQGGEIDRDDMLGIADLWAAVGR